MKLKLVSDLHLEFADLNIQNNHGCDVLILAGDIMVSQDLHDHPQPLGGMWEFNELAGLGERQRKAQSFRDFLKRVSFQFPHVIYVAGNHEFYHGKFYNGLDYLRSECGQYSNIYFLENETKTIDGVVFVGATLWTDMNRGDPITMHAIKDMINDYRTIRNDLRNYAKLSPTDTVIRHKKSLEYFRETVDQHPNDRCVVVGHHAPSHLSTDPRYESEFIMNGAYRSDLSDFILDRPQIKLWCHGHMHNASDYMIGGTRIVCNPRGYQSPGYSEQTGWNPELIIEI